MELFQAPDLHRRPVGFPSFSSSPPTAAANPGPANASPLMEDVVAALEHATSSAKHLSFCASSPAATADASEAASAIASLRNAHRVIGSFLGQFEPPRPPLGDGTGGGGGGDEPMGDWAVAVEEAGEVDASSDVGEVEEGNGECGLQSKRRRKRPVTPSWPAGRMGDREVAEADPVDRRRSAMDLVFQFHG